jgi:DNA invertase Pin-like site-specific DNA recombinase
VGHDHVDRAQAAIPRRFAVGFAKLSATRASAGLTTDERERIKALDRLGKDNIGFKSLRETSVDTTSPQGRLVVNILASISEFERELIHARMTEGRKRAVANGVKFGPKFKLNSFQRQEALARLAAGESQSVIAKTYGVDPATISRLQGKAARPD